MSSEFTFVTVLTSQIFFEFLMNLVHRDLTEHQITQTLTLSRLDAQLGADKRNPDCSLTRNKLTGADKVNPTV